MKKLISVIPALLSLTACSESFERVDTTAFNRQIASRTDIKTPEQLIELYYAYPANEGKPGLSVQTRRLDDNRYETTLIHERLQDDSKAGVKIVMTAQTNGPAWLVTEIKRNWKCWQGRGHTGWGTGKCN
jgi:hypothetical protein